jgi:hypothetical protein
MNTAYKQVMLGSLAMVLAGCGGGSTGSGNVEFSALSMKRVYVDAATQEQWESILVACGDDGAMNCAVVCHVPPGHPDNRHTITVGVNAVKAHLRHTHADRKNGAIGDYLGDCNASPDDGDTGGTPTDGGSTGGDTGGAPTDGGSTGGDTGTGGDPVVNPPATDTGSTDSGSTGSGTTPPDDGTNSGYADYYEPYF